MIIFARWKSLKNTLTLSSISAILQKYFPGKTFSKSFEHMFPIQQLSLGTRVADDFLSRISKHKSNDKSKDQSDE